MKRLALVFLLLSFGQHALGQAETKKPSLSVTGAGEVMSPPDQAIVRLGVTHQSPSASEAQQRVNRISQEILSGIRALGIDRKQIQTSQLTLHPVYSSEGIEPVRREQPRVVGYRASNVVAVTLDRAMEKVGPVVDAGLKAGANQIEGIHFQLKDDGEARRRALTEAAREAREKAETIAQALSVQITGIEEVTEGGVSVMPAMMRGEVMMAARADASTPVSPGEVRVTASLSVRYGIAQK